MISPQQMQSLPQEAFDWYDEYAHGLIDRRTFMNRLTSIATSTLSVSMICAALLPQYEAAEQVSFNDPDIIAHYLKYPSPKGHGEGRGYFVCPREQKKGLSPVLVIHENRGLNPYIKDVARRLAKAGFMAFAPDALHSLGGYPGNDDQGREMQRSLDRSKIEQDFIAAALFLKNHAQSNQKLGAVGFCFGGYIVNMLAATLGEQLQAGVPFYGTPAAEEIRKNIKAPLILQFAELDQRVNQSWNQYEKDLKEHQVSYKAYTYEGAHHGFHNDSTARYHQGHAELAWKRTLEHFRKNLI